MTNAAALWIKSQEANAKAIRNGHKLAWMDATRRMGAEVVYFEPQLARYNEEARIAGQAFADAVAGKSAEEIVAIIMEAGR